MNALSLAWRRCGQAENIYLTDDGSKMRTDGIDPDINQPHPLEPAQEASISPFKLRIPQQCTASPPPSRQRVQPLRRWKTSADGGESEPAIGNATQVGSCRAMGGERRPAALSMRWLPVELGDGGL